MNKYFSLIRNFYKQGLYCLLGVISIFGSQMLYAQTILYPTNIDSPVQLTNMSYLDDSMGIFTHLTIDTESFKPLEKNDTIKRADQEPKIWLHFSLLNKSSDSCKTYLALGRYEKSTVYIKNLNDSKFISVGEIGEKNNKKRGEDIHVQEVVSLMLPPYESVEIIVELHFFIEKFRQRDIKPILYKTIEEVKQAKSLSYYENRYSVILHFFLLGFFLFQLFWIGFQCFQLRGTEYFYYFAYILALFVYYFSKIEYTDGFYLFFTYYPQWTIYFGKALPLFAYLMYCHFFNIVFKVKENYFSVYPYLNTLLILMSVLLIFDIIVVTGFNKINIETKVVSVIVPLLAVWSFIIVTFIWYKKQDSVSNRIMLGSITFLIAASLSHILSNPSWIPMFLKDTILSREPLLPMGIGSVIEVYLFSTALAYKSKLTDRAKLDIERENVRVVNEKYNLLMDIRDMQDDFWLKIHNSIKSNMAIVSHNLMQVQFQLEKKDNIKKIEAIISHIYEISLDVTDHEWLYQTKPEFNTIGALAHKLKDFAEKKCHTVEPNIEFYYQLTSDNPDSLIDFKMKNSLFNITKQAISNAVKHSQCHLLGDREGYIALNVRYTEGVDVKIEIEDNGKGFDPKLVKSEVHRGNGIDKMKKLAEKIEGQLTIDSQIMGGTKIIFSKILV